MLISCIRSIIVALLLNFGSGQIRQVVILLVAIEVLVRTVRLKTSIGEHLLLLNVLVQLFSRINLIICIF